MKKYNREKNIKMNKVEIFKVARIFKLLMISMFVGITLIFLLAATKLLAQENCTSENEQVRAGKDILASIGNNQKKIEGMNTSNYQKDINKDIADWTRNLENKLGGDIKSKKQIIEPKIEITAENKRDAYEIIKKSQSIMEEALGTSNNVSKYTSVSSYTDFLIFTSFSIGEKNLESLIKLASEYNGAVILRGFKNGSVQDTAAFISNISSAKEGVLIDPNLFKEYQITKVPTFILTKPCEGVIDGSNCKVIYDKLVGNVSPRYALERFAARGELLADAKERMGR